MNINDYRRGMDRIAPDPKLKERIMRQKNTKRNDLAPRRAGNGLLAAALAMACLFTVALAASPELRTAVLSFFRMEEREQVPSSSAKPDGPDISNAEIGALVKAQYIKMDSYRYGFSNGLLTDLTWSDDYKTLLDAKFWEPRDGELIPVEVDMQTSQIDITFRDIHYQGEFWWFLHKGQLVFFTGDNRTWDEEGEHAWDWNFSLVPGRTDVLLLRLSTGTQMDYTEYPFLYHLDTGEAEDILAGTGVDKLEYAYGWDWSENMRRAIILCDNRLGMSQTWFCDLDAKTLVQVDELADIEIYTAAFADNDTLILHSSTIDESGVAQDVACYSYDIPTGRIIQTLGRAPYYRSWEEGSSGVEMSGSRCVLISEDGQARAVDLKTGAQTLLEGLTFHQNDNLQFNLSGNRLLYFSMDSKTDGLGISQIGVADLEKGIFFAFDREGYENLYERGIGWADDHTVSIRASTLDDETHYLLLYQF